MTNQIDNPIPSFQRRRLSDADPRRLPAIHTDVLVLGGGVAGLSAAIEAARGANVIIMSKVSAMQSTTQFAQGGIAAAWSEEDSVEAHVEDTMRTGCGLCDPKTVQLVIEQAPVEIRNLEKLGARFDRYNNRLDLAREGGHSARRVVHAHGDATGAEVMRTLLHRVEELSRIRSYTGWFAVDLLTCGTRVVGALMHHAQQGFVVVRAEVVVLATGGAAAIYRDHTNPPASTGDGLAMALRAGAVLRDMEFVQFHPTVFHDAQGRALLMTEALRGEGAVLRNVTGRRFMPEYDERGELAPRDIVSRAIHDVLRRTSAADVFLDARHLGAGRFATRFPQIHQNLQSSGLNPCVQLIPVRPAAHYTIGGISTDVEARTSLDGLLACGEVASSGLHGANRLASNSLLEGLVFGRRAGRTALDELSRPARCRTLDQAETMKHGDAMALGQIHTMRQWLGVAMQRYVGIEREETSLRRVLNVLRREEPFVVGRKFSSPVAWETQNMWTLANCIATCVERRQESRGVHFRTDHPEVDNTRWRVHSTVKMTRIGLQDHYRQAPVVQSDSLLEASMT